MKSFSKVFDVAHTRIPLHGLLQHATVLVSPRCLKHVYLNKPSAALGGKIMSDELSVPNPSQQVSVLVVDDADVIRRTLRNFLKGEPAIKLLGEASNFAEAISMTAALQPDVIL
jgi:PleD family two-component response regulator